MSLSRATIIAAALAISTIGAVPGHAAEVKEVRLLMNWFAQADQSGYWQAQLDQTGKDAGIKFTTLQGGPKIQTVPQVGAGQAEFGLGNADDVLLARLRGAPVKAVFVSLDYVPYSLVYHLDPAVKSITDLKSKTFAVSLGFAYWEWLKKQYGLQGAHEIPVSGDLGLFKNDPNMVQQGYSIFLPYRMTAADIPNAQIKVAELGYRPYDVLFTTDEMIEKQPALVRAAVAAIKKAWGDFIDDPSRVKPVLLQLNGQISPEVHDQAVKDMIADLLPRDHSKIGCMADERWEETAKQLRDVNFLPASFDPKTAYDRTLVPGC
jgi:NitT/TauT family transport system substrate-binding protein